MKRVVLYLALGVAVAFGLASTSCGADHGAMSEPPVVTPSGEPPIVVDRPAASDSVESPVTISGTANVFEANVTVQVLDEKGHVLDRTFTTATCGTGCRGSYSTLASFKVAHEQHGTIVVSDDDAAGTGTPPHVVRVPVVLVPPSR